ncbi:hypothetical protein SAMN04487995_0360 [Dyadobacter koreensis]|uniref:Uncharacterized protein n=1 Tax=Dyadobacter koreensis TaxID=408657 RepID=A0A1H6QJ36_9BACT|nr:hypothetical protein SAMN04487995_0360 [Dyadobacter koreensis]
MQANDSTKTRKAKRYTIVRLQRLPDKNTMNLASTTTLTTSGITCLGTDR